MNLFFGNISNEGFALLTEEDSGHCIRVLRMKTGDDIALTDGEGNYLSGTIIDPNPKKCLVQISGIKKQYGKRNYSLHIAIAPTKNIDRFEWFLEKATEIGIDEITPVICERSERRVLKTDRLNKVLLSAMKQSLKAYLPKLNEPAEFKKFIAGNISGQKYFCAMNAETYMKDLIAPQTNALVLIGPEGDFTDTEILFSLQNNYARVSLGNSRLRTETAGIVACTVVSLLNH